MKANEIMRVDKTIIDNPPFSSQFNTTSIFVNALNNLISFIILNFKNKLFVNLLNYLYS